MRAEHFFLPNSLLILLSLGMFACGGGGSSGTSTNSNTSNSDSTNTQSAGSNSIVDCNRTIESLAQGLDDNVPNSIPSWTQLACYTADLTRQPLPAVYIHAGQQPPTEELTSSTATAFDNLTDTINFYASWPATNVSNFIFSNAPPYLTDAGTPFYPQNDDEWDTRMRAMATLAIYAKSLGYVIVVSYFFPPSFYDFDNGSSPWAEPTSSSEMLSFWRNTYIPQRVALAQMAERVRAEYLQPWDLELERTIAAFGDQWLSSLSENERVTVAQTMNDELHAALDAVFSGALIGLSYDRYSANSGYWRNLNFSAWDMMHFALFTEGDVQATRIYLDQQINGYVEMVERDNITNWALQEVTINPETHARLLPTGTQFSAIEAQLYQAVFDKINTLNTKPMGISITAGHIQTEAAATLVRNQLTEYLNNGF